MNKWLRLIIRFFLGIAMVGALVFIPAGTIRFWNGWLFLTILTIPMAVSGVTLMINAPELLTKRLDTKESDPIQRRIILSIGIIFCAAFICAGFDFRFSWSRVPLWVVLPASAVYLAGYGFMLKSFEKTHGFPGRSKSNPNSESSIRAYTRLFVIRCTRPSS